MSLREAAALPEEEPKAAPRRDPTSGFWRHAAGRAWYGGAGFEPPPGFEERWGRAKRDDERWRRPEDEKRQWRAAYEAARRRGLDDEPEAPPKKPFRQTARARSSRRMNPFQHAQALIRETSMPLSEIAAITRLNIYQVVELKLKMREDAGAARRARA